MLSWTTPRYNAAFLLLVFGSIGRAGPCEWKPQPNQNLTVRDGYRDFIDPAKLAPFKAQLPQIDDVNINVAMRDPDTMWYDDESMIFLYQDSVESVVGGRANCVGRKVGEENASNPGIAKLKNYFGTDYKFLFPFRTVAGTDQVTNVRTLNFWAPPKRNGQVMPVKWWKASSRGRWHWVFPVGTIFGEVLFEKDPGQVWRPFEIRIRRRYIDGWGIDLFRPFIHAQDLAAAIKVLRPNWASSNLAAVVGHLENPATLKAHRLESKAYGKVFPPIDGSLDVVPPIPDTALVTELLTQYIFRSAKGEVWKENGPLETYAPASAGDYSIVPKGYELGMIEVNEISCGRCHIETGRPLLHFEFDIQLYGEVWGEDRIFTWHLFEPHRYIYNTFDDADGSRKLNALLMQAKLLKNEKPSASDPDYRALPTPF